MKISIITINRNNADGLERTLRSIAAQLPALKGHELEHIVVDGMSTDGSLSRLIPELPSRIEISEPKGVYHALNVGVPLANGDIIGLLHAGDVYTDDNVLARIVETFVNNRETDFIWSDVTLGRRYYSGADFTPKILEIGYAPPHTSLFMRTGMASAMGKYDESFKVAADFEYFVRLFTHTDFKGQYLPGATVAMEPGGMSQLWRNRLWYNNSERLRSLRKNGLPASLWRVLSHYKIVLKGYLCSPKKT